MPKFDTLLNISAGSKESTPERVVTKDIPEIKRNDLEKLKEALGEPIVENVTSEILSCLPDPEMMKKYKDYKLSELIKEIIQNKELFKYFGDLNPQQRIDLFEKNIHYIKSLEDPTQKLLKQLPQEIQEKIEKMPLSSEEKKLQIEAIYTFRKSKGHTLADPKLGGLYGIHVSVDDINASNGFIRPQNKQGKYRTEGGSVDYTASFSHMFGGNHVRLKDGAHIYIIERINNDQLTNEKEKWYKAIDERKIIDKIDLPRVKQNDPESQKNLT